MIDVGTSVKGEEEEIDGDDDHIILVRKGLKSKRESDLQPFETPVPS